MYDHVGLTPEDIAQLLEGMTQIHKPYPLNLPNEFTYTCANGETIQVIFPTPTEEKVTRKDFQNFINQLSDYFY